MDPLGQPVNTRSQAVAGAGEPVSASPVPGLDPITDLGKGAKPANPPAAKPAKGLPGVAQVEALEKALVPVSAAAGAFIQPEGPFGRFAIKVATGFKVGEVGEQVNKVTPGAALFLLPEPVGVLPERFFMSKPRIPGTNVYLDPLYNYTRYRERSRQSKREQAGAAQLAALRELVPTLTDAELGALRNNTELTGRAIAFADPRAVDTILAAELEARRVLPQPTGAASLTNQALVGEAVASFLTGDVALLSTLPDFVPSASIQPQAIEPVNAAALANQRAATGLRKELVGERADP